MSLSDRKIREVSPADHGGTLENVVAASEPLVLKGFVSDWPVVQAGRESPDAAVRYLNRYYRNATVGVWLGGPEIKGRFFYNADLTGFNYQPAMVKLDVVLDKILEHQHDADPPSIYVGSTTVDACLPGFRDENDVDFGDIDPLASIWIGNKTRIAAHFDVPDNIACAVVGRRRFTVLPPAQLENLYIGPLDFTPAGQWVSLVDFENPDFERFPKFEIALQEARVAHMDPGDAIFIPSMWWHHVQALDSLNVLINYWWRQSPAFMGAPIDVLNHALLSLRDLPPAQRDAWRNIFQKYVFEADENTFAHIPEQRRGVLSPLDETTARKLRAELLNRLNR